MGASSLWWLALLPAAFCSQDTAPAAVRTDGLNYLIIEPATPITALLAAQNRSNISASPSPVPTDEPDNDKFTAVTPVGGPSKGGTAVTISGSGMSKWKFCQFGTVSVPAVAASEGAVVCKSPKVDPTATDNRVKIGVSEDGQLFVLTAMYFMYIAVAPEVTELNPTCISRAGGEVEFTGKYFDSLEQMGVNSKAAGFVAKCALKAPEDRKSGKTGCVAPGCTTMDVTSIDYAEASIGKCMADAAMIGTYKFGLAVNGQDFIFYDLYVRVAGAPTIEEVHPKKASMLGGLPITIVGKNLGGCKGVSEDATCLFGDTVRKAVKVTEHFLVCIAPNVAEAGPRNMSVVVNGQDALSLNSLGEAVEFTFTDTPKDPTPELPAFTPTPSPTATPMPTPYVEALAPTPTSVPPVANATLNATPTPVYFRDPYTGEKLETRPNIDVFSPLPSPTSSTKPTTAPTAEPTARASSTTTTAPATTAATIPPIVAESPATSPKTLPKIKTLSSSPAATPVKESTCMEDCYGHTCNYWVDEAADMGLTCAVIEEEFGCDCTGCEACALHHVPTAPRLPDFISPTNPVPRHHGPTPSPAEEGAQTLPKIKQVKTASMKATQPEPLPSPEFEEVEEEVEVMEEAEAEPDAKDALTVVKLRFEGLVSSFDEAERALFVTSLASMTGVEESRLLVVSVTAGEALESVVQGPSGEKKLKTDATSVIVVVGITEATSTSPSSLTAAEVQSKIAGMPQAELAKILNIKLLQPAEAKKIAVDMVPKANPSSPSATPVAKPKMVKAKKKVKTLKLKPSPAKKLPKTLAIETPTPSPEVSEAELPPAVKPPPPKPEDKKKPAVLVPPNLKRLKYWADHDAATDVTYLVKAALADESRVSLNNYKGMKIGDEVVLNPGGSTEETRKVIGFGARQHRQEQHTLNLAQITDETSEYGSLILGEPIEFSHAAGESVIKVLKPPPDATAVPTPQPTRKPAKRVAAAKPKPVSKPKPPTKVWGFSGMALVIFGLMGIITLGFMLAIVQNCTRGKRGMNAVPIGDSYNRIGDFTVAKEPVKGPRPLYTETEKLDVRIQ